MPSAEAYLIRREADGTMRTVTATSIRNAMIRFIATYSPPVGERYRVKLRCGGDWTFFSVTANGPRTVQG